VALVLVLLRPCLAEVGVDVATGPEEGVALAVTLVVNVVIAGAVVAGVAGADDIAIEAVEADVDEVVTSEAAEAVESAAVAAAGSGAGASSAGRSSLDSLLFLDSSSTSLSTVELLDVSLLFVG